MCPSGVCPSGVCPSGVRLSGVRLSGVRLSGVCLSGVVKGLRAGPGVWAGPRCVGGAQVTSGLAPPQPLDVVAELEGGA